MKTGNVHSADSRLENRRNKVSEIDDRIETAFRVQREWDIVPEVGASVLRTFDKQSYFIYAGDRNDDAACFVADCGCHDKSAANAAFLVRACNAHDALLAACKSLVDDFNLECLCFEEGVPQGTCEICEAKAAIALAENGY